MKTIQFVLLGILLVSVYSQNCGQAACTTGNICDRQYTHTDAACVDATSGACATGYTDLTTGAAATPAGTTKTAACVQCVTSTHALNAKSAAATKCIQKSASTETCQPGYTDNAAGAAATAVGGTIQAQGCVNCAANYFGNHFTSGSVTLCISASTGTCLGGIKNHPTTADACIDVTSATNCKTGAFKNHATAASATLCIDATQGSCLSSQVKNHPTTADACIDVTSAANCKTGAFKNHATAASATACIVAGGTCLSGTVKNAKEGDHDACILSTASATNKCKEGYTDGKDGDAVKTSNTLTDCVFCASGYKENATTKKCEKSSGQMIAYGFMLLFVLLSVLF